MMKIFIFLLLAVLIRAQCSRPESCLIEDVINERINCAVTTALAKAKLDCTSVSSKGADTDCPSGFKAVSCSCGMACGSWNLRGDSGCHCQCANIDWTSATCCRIG